MKLALVASLFALAAAAPQIPLSKTGIVPPGLVGNQFLAGQYYHPNNQYYRGGYDQYYHGGVNPYDPNFQYRGQYDPKHYDAKYYTGAYDPKHYDAKYYTGAYDPKYHGGVYDPKVHKYPYQYQQYHGEHVPILEQTNEANPDGSFRYSYATADGQQARAEGFVKQSDLNPQDEANVIRGEYSYTAPDGSPVAYSYIADEHGFRVEGTHVPKVHSGVHKGLEYNGHIGLDHERYYPQLPHSYYGKSLAAPGVARVVPVAPAPAPVVPAPVAVNK